MTASPAKLRAALEVAAEQIQKQKILIEAQNELLHWALGEGPLPCDEEAERAAWGYLRATCFEYGLSVTLPYFKLMRGLLTSRCPDEFEVPTMPWSEALRRLREATELRVSMGRIKEALRRAMMGNRTGTIRALRGAVDVFGEPKASKPVELQWRIAELEAELQELRAVEAMAG